MTRSNARGFTLLEVMIAMAILALGLVALSDINAGAIAMHSYAKKLTVATFLAKSKMLDIESQLDSEGLPVEGDNISPSDGKFDDQGFPDFTWKVEVVAPKADNLDPTKIMNLVMGSSDGSAPSADSSSNSNPGSGLGGMGGGLLGMLMGGGSTPGSSSSPSSNSAAPSNPTSSGIGGMAGGMASSMMAGPAQMIISQITQMVREIHLTVMWMDGKNPQEFTVIEHLVSMGPNTPAGGTSNSGTKTQANGLPSTNVPGAASPSGAAGGSTIPAVGN